MGLAVMVSKFDFELYETSENDVDFISDSFVPVPEFESKGVRMLVKYRACRKAAASSL